MRLLITNDDGYDAEGILVLAEALSKKHQVRIFAPEKERSGLPTRSPSARLRRIRMVRDGGFTCSGTPTDCVLLAMLGAIGFHPDAVVSGINRGPNLGTDIVYLRHALPRGRLFWPEYPE